MSKFKRVAAPIAELEQVANGGKGEFGLSHADLMQSPPDAQLADKLRQQEEGLDPWANLDSGGLLRQQLIASKQLLGEAAAHIQQLIAILSAPRLTQTLHRNANWPLSTG